MNNPLLDLPVVDSNIVLLEAKQIFDTITKIRNNPSHNQEVRFLGIISSTNERILLEKGYEIEHFLNTTIGTLNNRLCTRVTWKNPKPSVDVSEQLQNLKI